jgi:hypothetical protein
MFKLFHSIRRWSRRSGAESWRTTYGLFGQTAGVGTATHYSATGYPRWRLIVPRRDCNVLQREENRSHAIKGGE